MELLEIENLTVRFGGVEAIGELSFTVRKDEIYGLIGPNGAGKSTLFNVLSRLVKPLPGAKARFDQIDLLDMAPHRVPGVGIARTFQNIELFPHMTVLDNVMTGRHVHMRAGLARGGMPWLDGYREAESNRKRVEEILDLLELQAYRKQLVSFLSYGVQKKVELARALALEPKLLLLDEPTAGMNLEEKQDFMFWMEDIQGMFGCSILMIEHDMGMIMKVCDRILALNFGRKIVEGVPEEVSAHPEVIKAYLGEEDEDA